MSLAHQPPNQNPTDCSDLRGNIPARLLRKIVAKHIKTSIVSRAEAQPDFPGSAVYPLPLKTGYTTRPQIGGNDTAATPPCTESIKRKWNYKRKGARDWYLAGLALLTVAWLAATTASLAVRAARGRMLSSDDATSAA
jgi:hypothetical protein